MIKILEDVFKMASEFPEKEQEVLADYWIQEMKTPNFIEMIKDEIKWHKSFSESYDVLEMMADNALKEAKLGKAKEIGWEDL